MSLLYWDEVSESKIKDWREHKLRLRIIPMVKVAWGDPSTQDCKWKKNDMREEYPNLFKYLMYCLLLSFSPYVLNYCYGLMQALQMLWTKFS